MGNRLADLVVVAEMEYWIDPDGTYVNYAPKLNLELYSFTIIDWYLFMFYNQ